MIRLENVSKTFFIESGEVQAVRDANIEINEGEIFGFIGYSGAGKSTIVRCINLLERPTTGKVYLENVDLTSLSEKDLRKQRKNIGMIFQQFNLLSSLTVGKNVAFNLRDSVLSKTEIDKRVDELLKLVGISDKKDAYPSQLSGGQKQRVAIARALANNPKVLLCDEATSALDPKTTHQILDLLKDLNKKLGLTVVIITHEMHVIKSICDKVAVMEDGKIVEVNDVFNIFANPKEAITKHFVNSTSNKKEIEDLIINKKDIFGINKDSQVLELDFTGSNTKDSVISQISRNFNIDCSIIFADINVIKEQMLGKLIVSLTGDANKIDLAKEYLDSQGVSWEVIV